MTDKLEIARVVIASAYQAVGALATTPADTFDSDDVQRLLSYLSDWESLSLEQAENILPWSKAPLT